MAYKDSTAERTTITRNLRELEAQKLVTSIKQLLFYQKDLIRLILK